MSNPEPMDNASPELELDVLIQQMLQTQLNLGKNLTATSQFLRFVLSVANENLGIIRTQLEKIRELADEIEDCDCA